MPPRRPLLFRVARIGFGVAGVAFLLLALSDSVGSARQQVLPSASAAAGAIAVLLAGVVAGAWSWVSLLEDSESRRPLAYVFLLSQLGKYIPGGVWQFVGQATFTLDKGVTLQRVLLSVPVHIAVQLSAAGLLSAATLLLLPDVPARHRVLCLLGLLPLPLLTERGQQLTIYLAARLRLISTVEPVTHSQPAMAKSLVLALVTLTASGTAFAILLASTSRTPFLLSAIPGFALAWLAGFLALPVPAGIGIRELVLVALLPGQHPAVIAASICHRAATIVSEAVAIVLLRSSR